MTKEITFTLPPIERVSASKRLLRIHDPRTVLFCTHTKNIYFLPRTEYRLKVARADLFTRRSGLRVRKSAFVGRLLPAT
jgi:hypothetical protein